MCCYCCYYMSTPYFIIKSIFTQITSRVGKYAYFEKHPQTLCNKPFTSNVSFYHGPNRFFKRAIQWDTQEIAIHKPFCLPRQIRKNARWTNYCRMRSKVWSCLISFVWKGIHSIPQLVQCEYRITRTSGPRPGTFVVNFRSLHNAG